jgi:hypothetical protein
MKCVLGETWADAEVADTRTRGEIAKVGLLLCNGSVQT